MRFKFRQPAPDGSVFGPEAFSKQRGEPIRVSKFGQPIRGTLVDVKVAGDGSSAELTIEVPDGTIPEASPQASMLG